jgi:hypothetical protein
MTEPFETRPLTVFEYRSAILDAAMRLNPTDVQQLVAYARAIEQYFEAPPPGTVAPPITAQPKETVIPKAPESAGATQPADSQPSSEKKPRGRPRKNTDAPAAASNGAPAVAASGPVAVASTPETATTATADEKQFTETDVRVALVNLQTALGSADKSKAILAKYSPTKVISGVPEAERRAVIADCLKAMPSSGAAQQAS